MPEHKLHFLADIGLLEQQSSTRVLTVLCKTVMQGFPKREIELQTGSQDNCIKCVLNVYISVHLQKYLTFILPVLNLARNSILSLHFLCPVFACILLVFKLHVNNFIILTGYLENLLKYLHNPAFPINIVIS